MGTTLMIGSRRGGFSEMLGRDLAREWAGAGAGRSIRGPGPRGSLGGAAMIPLAVLGGELAVPCTCNPLQQG